MGAFLRQSDNFLEELVQDEAAALAAAITAALAVGFAVLVVVLAVALAVVVDTYSAEDTFVAE